MYAELIPNLLDNSDVIDIRTPLTVKFRFYNASDNIILSTDLFLFTVGYECIFNISSKPAAYSKGIIEGECKIPGNFLNDGSYFFTLYFAKDTFSELFSYDECLIFDIADYRVNINRYNKWMGYVRPNFPLLLNPIDDDLKS